MITLILFTLAHALLPAVVLTDADESDLVRWVAGGAAAAIVYLGNEKIGSLGKRIEALEAEAKAERHAWRNAAHAIQLEIAALKRAKE